MSYIPARPNFYLTDEAFQLLKGEGHWKIHETPLHLAAEIKGHFGIETSFCVFTSGIDSPPEGAGDDSDTPVAGIDWVRHEDNPRPDEPPFNVYHYMITKKVNEGYPVFYLGKEQTVAPHWSTLDDLKVYFEDWK
jgi:hypothetical protein